MKIIDGIANFARFRNPDIEAIANLDVVGSD
jgi:hypothetical protein